jgi:hypothetical protein
VAEFPSITIFLVLAIAAITVITYLKKANHKVKVGKS